LVHSSPSALDSSSPLSESLFSSLTQLRCFSSFFSPEESSTLFRRFFFHPYCPFVRPAASDRWWWCCLPGKRGSSLSGFPTPASSSVFKFLPKISRSRVPLLLSVKFSSRQLFWKIPLVLLPTSSFLPFTPLCLTPGAPIDLPHLKFFFFSYFPTLLSEKLRVLSSETPPRLLRSFVSFFLPLTVVNNIRIRLFPPILFFTSSDSLSN